MILLRNNNYCSPLLKMYRFDYDKTVSDKILPIENKEIDV